ncbi:MAG: hydrogenase maturation protease [bacterium]
MRTLVLGLGNPILSDDGVGVRVVERVREYASGRTDLEVDTACVGGLRLMERMTGWDRVILVDAMVSGAEPGTIRAVDPSHLPTFHSSCSHDTSLKEALELGRRAGMCLPGPGELLCVVVEAEDVHTFSERCTPAVEAAIPRAAERVLEMLPRRDTAPV